MTDPEAPLWRGPERCTARSSRTGERCQRSPIKGGTVCTTHGGSSPIVRAAAERRIEEGKARAVLGSLGITDDPSQLPQVSVAEQLMLAASAHVMTVRWIELQVRDLPADQVPAAAWTKLLTEQRRDRDRLLVEIARLGIDAAAVDVMRNQGAQVVDLLRRVLSGLGHDPGAPEVVTVVTRELQATEGEAA